MLGGAEAEEEKKNAKEDDVDWTMLRTRDCNQNQLLAFSRAPPSLCRKWKEDSGILRSGMSSHTLADARIPPLAVSLSQAPLLTPSQVAGMGIVL